MIAKITKYLNAVARGLEIAISIVVLAAVVVKIFSLRDLFLEMVADSSGMVSFQEFLDSVLTIVIGLEFFRMLCYPDSSTVLEVLVFVLARHMIVNATTAVENLLTVLGIGATIFMNIVWERHKRSLHPFQKDWEEETQEETEE